MPGTRFEGAQAILRVEDMQRSLRYYLEVLGFTNAEWGNDDFTHMHCDGAGIYLCQGAQGQPGPWVWIGVEHPDGHILRLGFEPRADMPIEM